MTSSAGVTLDTLLGATPLPADEALRHILKLAITLRSAHQEGRVFGVVDPSCIALDENGAVIETSEAGISSFAAPEVLAGGQPDIRSDVFVFGAIAYQLLTGRLPFPDDATEAPAPLSADELPGLSRVILRCLERDPDQRWQNLRSVCVEVRLLSVAASRLGQVVKNRQSLMSELREQVRRLEQVVDSHVDSAERNQTEMRDSLSETRDYLRTAFDFAEGHLRTQALTIETLQQKIAHADELASRVNHMEVRLSKQAESITSAQMIAAETDELVERIVESIDSLQSFILNRVAD